MHNSPDPITLQQRHILERHQRDLQRAESPWHKRFLKIKSQKPHLKAAVTILASFAVFAICFQTSRAEFDETSTSYLTKPNQITDQGAKAVSKTVATSVPKPTSTTTPEAAIPSTLPATDQPSEDKPSTGIQYTASGYAYGQCTWYVSHRRPIPQNWGNARDWLANSKKVGFTSGKYARPGAIGQTTAGYYGHVVYVEQIQDGKVYVSEMNYVGWNRLSYRWAKESDFNYIY